MSIPTFEKYHRALTPPPLAGKSGVAYAGVLGRAKDAVLERMKDAVRARFPSRAPSDALPFIGDNVQLEAGPDESEEAYRARLKDAFNVWKWAGTRKGILEYALKPAGFPNASLITNRQWSPAPPDGDTTKWARFWATIYKPHPWLPTFVDDSWGVGDPDITVGSTASPNDVARVRRLLEQWKSARDTCVGVFIVFGGVVHLWDSPPVRTWAEAEASGDTWGDDSPHSIFWPF